MTVQHLDIIQDIFNCVRNHVQTVLSAAYCLGLCPSWNCLLRDCLQKKTKKLTIFSYSRHAFLLFLDQYFLFNYILETKVMFEELQPLSFSFSFKWPTCLYQCPLPSWAKSLKICLVKLCFFQMTATSTLHLANQMKCLQRGRLVILPLPNPCSQNNIAVRKHVIICRSS